MEIYGIKSICEFGRVDSNVFHFQTMESAKRWLKRQESDFYTKRIVTSKAAAIELAGAEAVEMASDYDALEAWEAVRFADLEVVE